MKGLRISGQSLHCLQSLHLKKCFTKKNNPSDRKTVRRRGSDLRVLIVALLKLRQLT